MLINDCKSTLMAAALIQIYKSRPGLTPLLSGAQGIGKTQIVEQVAKGLNGELRVLDGSILNEGEATGLPIVAKSVTGELEVQFAKHADIQAIKNLQKYYYEKVKEEGFLDGRIKMDPETEALIIKQEERQADGKMKLVEKVYPKDISRAIIDGIDNQYAWGGDELSPEMKIELLRKKEIKPVVLFIDEINRCDMQTMKQLMNIILERRVNGYKFPWWVVVIAAMNPANQGSTFATIQFDPAQRDRFCKIPVETNLTTWTEYALEKGLNQASIEALVASEDIFIERDTKNSDNVNDMTGSARSWEIVSNIYDCLNDVLSITEFFSDEDRKDYEKILRTLVYGKVGDVRGNTWLANIKNNDLNTPPEKLFTGKSDKIAEDMMARLKKQSALRKKCTVNSVIVYLCNHWTDFEKKDMSKDEDKKRYANFQAQVKEFLDTLDRNPRLAFFKQLIQESMKKYVCSDGVSLYKKVARFASKDVLLELAQFSEQKRQLTDN